MFDLINRKNWKIKIGGILEIDLLQGFLLFLSLILTPSAAINILNQANQNINELTMLNTVIMYAAFIVNLMLICIIKTDKLCNKRNLPRIFSLILSLIISTSLTLLIVLFIAPFTTKYTVNHYIYSDKVNNLANISASLQYHSLNQDEKETINKTFNIKQDLLENIVEVENYQFDRKNLTLEDITFNNLIGILIYTDPKIVDSYNEQLPLILEKKKKIFAKNEFEKYYDKYKNIALKRKKEHNEEVDLYNAKLKKLKTMQARIDEDYRFLKNEIEKEWSLHQNYIKKINHQSDLYANYFVNKKKNNLIKILEKLVTGGKCKNEKCRVRAINEYNKKFSDLTKNYDYWLSVKKPTKLNYALEQTAQLVFSGGMSLIYQLNPKYHSTEIKKVAKYIVTDDEHYFRIAKSLYFFNQFNNKEYPFEYDISKSDFKEAAPLVKKVIAKFKKQYGYEINGTAIKDKEVFNKIAKNHYASKIILNKPVDFKIFEQSAIIQQELKNNLDKYYISGMKLNIEPSDFKKHIIEKEIKELEVRKESTKQMFIDTLYPYHLIIITVLLFLLSVVSSIIAASKRELISIIFLIILGYIFLNPNNDYKLDKLDSFVDKVDSNSMLVKSSINIIIFTYPKMLDIEDIKKKYYLDILTDGYNKSRIIKRPI